MLILNVRPIVATSRQRSGGHPHHRALIRILEIIIGMILLGGAAWTMVRSYCSSLAPSARGFVTSGSGASGSDEVGDLNARTPTQVAAILLCFWHEE